MRGMRRCGEGGELCAERVRELWVRDAADDRPVRLRVVHGDDIFRVRVLLPQLQLASSRQRSAHIVLKL